VFPASLSPCAATFFVKHAKSFFEQPERYRESSQTQLTSHVFPPSDEKDCSIRDDLGEMLSQT
jgi:hypothetical protein